MRPQVILSVRFYQDELEKLEAWTKAHGKSISGGIKDAAMWVVNHNIDTDKTEQALEKEQTK